MPHDLSETLIRKKLDAFLAGKTSLEAFRRWFVPATWDVDEWASPRLQQFVYGIKLRLAEYSNNHWSKTELREKLLPFVTSLGRTNGKHGPKPGRPRRAAGARSVNSPTGVPRSNSATKGKRKSAK
jgi:hypothetical protein